MVWEVWFYDEDDKKHVTYIIANTLEEAMTKAKIEDPRYDDGMPIF